MKNISDKQIKTFAWSLTLGISILGIVAWWQSYQGSIISGYQYFPLFGLLAFSVMWAHYVVAAIRMKLGISKEKVSQYFNLTSAFVLFAILAHPGLFAWLRWQDTRTLPPTSYFTYVGQGMKIAVISGMIALTIFLAYEFRKFFGKKPWWKYVQYASDAAMLLIFVHAIRLGNIVEYSWYKYVWWLMGLSLVISIAVIYWPKEESKAVKS